MQNFEIFNKLGNANENFTQNFRHFTYNILEFRTFDKTLNLCLNLILT
jgi:hypothetical protein